MSGACEASLRAGGMLLFYGNGGSAADSQHLATELVVRLRASVTRPSWPVLSLTLNPAVLTAAGKDFGFDEVFACPLPALGRLGDVLTVLPTSGRSANVLRALELAGERGIGPLCGDGGPTAAPCEHTMAVPCDETARVQECHTALGHALVELLEERFMAAPL